jgi:hypothetical protein
LLRAARAAATTLLLRRLAIRLPLRHRQLLLRIRLLPLRALLLLRATLLLRLRLLLRTQALPLRTLLHRQLLRHRAQASKRSEGSRQRESVQADLSGLPHKQHDRAERHGITSVAFCFVDRRSSSILASWLHREAR